MSISLFEENPGSFQANVNMV